MLPAPVPPSEASPIVPVPEIVPALAVEKLMASAVSFVSPGGDVRRRAGVAADADPARWRRAMSRSGFGIAVVGGGVRHRDRDGAGSADVDDLGYRRDGAGGEAVLRAGDGVGLCQQVGRGLVVTLCVTRYWIAVLTLMSS